MSKSLPKSKEIKIAGNSVKIKKLPLGDIAKIISSLEEIPNEVAQIESLEKDQIFVKLPILIVSSLDKFIDILVKAIDDQRITKDVVNSLYLDDILDVIITILEVNNLGGILQRLKKAKALSQVKE